MSTTTTNLGLLKPELSDPADITALNVNWDKIDDELKKASEAGGNIPVFSATSTDGLSYSVDFGNLTLKEGTMVVIVPDKVNASEKVKINGDSLMRFVSDGYIIDSLGKFTLRKDEKYPVIRISTFYGDKWVLMNGIRPSAGDLSGTVAIANGGTGASTATNALANLGAASADMTNVTDEDFLSKATASGAVGIPIIEATSSDGVTYTATFEGLTVKNGTEIRIIPNIPTTSDTATKLKLNGTVYDVKLRISRYNGYSMSIDETALFSPGYPVNLVYSSMWGYFLQVGFEYTSPDTISGRIPVWQGGTGANTKEDARANLEAAPMYTYGTEDLTAGITALETGKLHFVYE